MNKIILKSFALIMTLGLVACGGNKSQDNKKDTIKVGLICVGDENDKGYTTNFLHATTTATQGLKEKGINVERVTKFNVVTEAECEAANTEFANSGCKIIINNSFDHEPGSLKVATNYKDIEFINCCNFESSRDKLNNTHNAFANIYEGRYIAGVAAGMKLQSLIDNKTITPEKAIIGYVGAFPYAEVKSGYTAYYLGAKSVCPSVTMKVKFVDQWISASEERKAATELVNEGCVMISQHSDSFAPAEVAESNGIFHTGYNSDMISVAPHASLISTRIDWSIYFIHAIETIANNQQLEQDWCYGMDKNAVVMTELNKEIAATGTESKLKEIETAIKNNTLHVFDTSTFTIDGERLEQAFAIDSDGDGIKDTGEAVTDGYYHESEFQSSPYFDLDIDGITIEDN